jgi:hypothetical protein
VSAIHLNRDCLATILYLPPELSAKKRRVRPGIIKRDARTTQRLP